MNTDNLLHSLIFFNPWILQNPTVKEFAEYGKKPETECLKPESFGLSNSDCRHKKVINMLDEQGFKPLSVLKDDPSFSKLNWFTHFRLKTTLEKFSTRNPHVRLRSKRVTLPSDKMDKTPLDYVSCTSESFKQTQNAPATKEEYC